MLLITLAFLIQDTEILTKSGQKVTGKLDKLVIETKSLGKLEIKVADLYSIQVATFRPLDEKDLQKKVEMLVKKLGDDDPAVRERSTDDLKTLGPSVLPLIEKHKDDPDKEIRDRIVLVIGFLKEVKGRTIDTVAGEGFVLNGLIRTLVLGSKEYDIFDIKHIKIDRKPAKNKGAIFTVTDRSKFTGELEDSEMVLTTEYGSLKIATKEITKILVSDNEVTVTTAKSSLKGEIKDKLRIKTQLGNFSIEVKQLMSYVAEGTLSAGIIDGKWKGTIKVVAGPLEEAEQSIVATFKQDGDRIEGTIAGPTSEKGVGQVKGTFDGETFQGDITIKEAVGAEYSMKIKGKLLDDSLEGEIEGTFNFGGDEMKVKAKLKLVRESE